MLQILPIFGNSIIYLIMLCISPSMLRLCSIYSSAQFHLFTLLHICLAAAWWRIYCNLSFIHEVRHFGSLKPIQNCRCKKVGFFSPSFMFKNWLDSVNTLLEDAYTTNAKNGRLALCALITKPHGVCT